MKELSIEEKAKAYDEALETARKINSGEGIAAPPGWTTCEVIFPELRESEDEKIRKAIIGYINHGQHYGVSNKDMISWLKKQGEQKSWSEEDEKMIKALLSICDVYSIKTSFYPKENEDIEKLKNWLKSLKPQNKYVYNPYKAVVESIAEMCKHYDKASHSGLRDFYDNVKIKCKDAKEYDSLYPQNTWKPSDEQMEELRKHSDNVILRNLYYSLKKQKS